MIRASTSSPPFSPPDLADSVDGAALLAPCTHRRVPLFGLLTHRAMLVSCQPVSFSVPLVLYSVVGSLHVAVLGPAGTARR